MKETIQMIPLFQPVVVKKEDQSDRQGGYSHDQRPPELYQVIQVMVQDQFRSDTKTCGNNEPGRNEIQPPQSDCFV